jgi:fatty acid CoA ligase FadD9
VRSFDRDDFWVHRNNVFNLAQGELAAAANLEAIYAGAPLVRQIFVYGNGKRPGLLAVIVPAPVAVAEYGNSPALKAALHQLLQQTAALAGLQSHEVPVDFLIETDPFTDENGLLSGVGKQLRSRIKEHYGERLEEMYTEIATAQVDETRVLRQTATNRPAVETLVRASRALLGSAVRPSNPISPTSAEIRCPRCGSPT